MAPTAHQTVIDRALSHEPIPGAIIVDRKERKAQAARFQKTRRLKQSFMGAVFLILLAAGWLYPLIGYFIPFCMVLGIGLAAFQGRSWYNWVCPRGSFEDAWLAKISRRRPIPPIFRSTRLRVAVMTFLMGMLAWQILRLWPNPWAIGNFFVLMLSITTAVAVGLGMILHQRTWCYLCPIGTMSNWVGKNRRPLTIAAEKCTQCNLCAQNCPMQLSPAAIKEQSSMPHGGDCLKCRVCVESCPKAALAFQKDSLNRAAA